MERRTWPITRIALLDGPRHESVPGTSTATVRANSRRIGRAVDPRVHLSGDLRRTTSRREADDRAPDEEHDVTIVRNESRSPS
jgi:hypothetical protein